MNSLPGPDDVPGGVLHSDLDGPACQPADEARAEADWWAEWWAQWTARRKAEAPSTINKEPSTTNDARGSRQP